MMKVDINKRKSDMRAMIEKLDITPTMYKNAIEKYKNLGTYLIDNGIDAEIYAQGSFALGTVIRPYRNNTEMKYDFDFICSIKEDVTKCSPKDIKMKIGDALKQSEVYSKILHDEYDRCWTLEYAEIGDVGFNMDIVPAVPNAISDTIRNEVSKEQDTAIAITHRVSENQYKWIKGNPKAYKDWFFDINKPFLEYERATRRQALFESNRSVFSSIEEVTEDYERSSLQKVIQILKRHRDVYFSKTQKENDKPITAITRLLQLALQAG